ncbi:uncharacterized protein LOC141690448 [Apium graveolens]|uniref:uncharacterized protein LOC141690448 n=1 Tax=Apium graveolens TaxID=4045 RepID=UPI003D7AB75F
MNNLSIFSAWSSLHPSVHKSTSFCAWFDDCFVITRGELPVRFLGVPLISSQLCINNCLPLIERITSKLHSWANLLFSLAGGAMLIKYIIHPIQSFGSNHFLLPTGVHYTIQSMLTKFLWKGNINNKGGAKVAWISVCLPKDEEGLGFKDMVQWNPAQILHSLIRVITKSNSLWANWVNKTALKNKHFWTLDIPIDCLWIWKKVLRLRSTTLQFISYYIVDRTLVSLWFEPWWQHCCLAKSISSPIIGQYLLSASAKVESIINSGTWCLPSINQRTHHRDPLLLSWLEGPHLTQIQYRGRDHILWDGFDCAKIKTWHIWNSLRSQGPNVVWFSLTTTQQCFLCVLGRETTSHIFLHFTYNRWVLNKLFSVIDIPVRERNARAHGKSVFGPYKLLQGIIVDIKAMLVSSTWYYSVVCSSGVLAWVHAIVQYYFTPAARGTLAAIMSAVGCVGLLKHQFFLVKGHSPSKKSAWMFSICWEVVTFYLTALMNWNLVDFLPNLAAFIEECLDA